MIPIKLHIKNFLSYGADIQTVNFEPYHLICLSGKNGHGKSALLDAITWATWGHARKLGGVAKADQGLLRLGQTQMMVSLDFVCAHQHYRVKREFMQTYGKPVTTLDFGMLDVEHDRYIPLTGKTIRETQAVIEKTINLDYESFINSAFLRQGQSNEFSKKSAKERKEVFATILGLNHYETIKKRATEKMRYATQEKATLAALMDSWTEKLKTNDDVLAHIHTIETHIAHAKLQEDTIEQAKQELSHKKNELAQRKQQYEHLKKEHEWLHQEEQKKLEELKSLWHTWRSTRTILNQATQLPALELTKQQLIEQLTQAQNTLQKHLELKEQYIKEKEIIQKLEQSLHEKKLKTQQAYLLAQEKCAFTIKHTQTERTALLTDLERKQKEQLTLIHKEEELSRLITQKTALITNKENIEKQFEKRKAHYHQWITQGNILSAELAQLQQKNSFVSDDTPSCPLCEQNLSASRRRFLKKQFADDELSIKHRVARLSSLIKKLKDILLVQHTQLETYRTHAQEIAALQAQKESLHTSQQTLKSSIDHLTETIKNHEKSIEHHQAEHEQLSKNNIPLAATHEHEELQTRKLALSVLEQALIAVKPHPTIIGDLHGQIQKIDHEIQKFTLVMQQHALQEQRQHAIKEMITHIRTLRTHQQNIALQISSYTDVEAIERTLTEQEELLHNEKQQVTKHKEQLLHEKGGYENQLTELQRLQALYEQQAHKIKEIDATIADYQAIAHATGKEGIQALLIEEAIPEVEQEANALLAKLTDNQTQLFIDSLRDLKKGGTKETLDIKISDATGMRPYELFSGGEAFRIDFALRVAISKLLARRAGASLQTLIIDEGFGSQDEEGLTHIMDALYKIQDDFAKIIIVSHLSTMKDQFPVHFVIEKGPQGSSVQILEHD